MACLQLREVEERASDLDAKRQRSESQVSTLIYNLDKAEAAVKQKEVRDLLLPASLFLPSLVLGKTEAARS